MKNTLKILILGDLHGEIPKIKINSNDYDIILCPGDLAGDELRPYIKKWLKIKTKTKNDKYKLENICSKQKQEQLNKISEEKLNSTLKYLNSLNKPIFLVPGNWDPNNNKWDNLISKFENIFDVDKDIINYNNINIIGYGRNSAPEILDEIPKHEFKTTQEFEEFKLELMENLNNFEKLSNKFQSLNKKQFTIFISHNSPNNTKLDLINSPETYAHNKHYGSIITRIMIQEFQPQLIITGHIHEGYGKQKIDKSLCINAGFGNDVNTILEINLKTKQISNIKFLGENKSNN